MDILIFFFLIFTPTIVFPTICYTYRRILHHKLENIKSIMHQEKAIKRYIHTYGTGNSDSNKIMRNLFDRFFHGKTYALPVIINIVIVSSVTILLYSKLGCSQILPEIISPICKNAPLSIIAGVIGATLWGLFDMLTRYRAIDLTPESLHFIWLRVLIAGSLGYIFSLGLQADLAIFTAFSVGVFPIKSLKNFLATKFLKQMQFSEKKQVAENPELHKIKGMTETVINRLGEEGIDSIQHLAYCDPIKLLLRTNIEWKVILDFVDQSLLFIYLDDNMVKLKPLGIRGAIELAEIEIALDSKDETEKNHANSMISIISNKINEKEDSVKSLIRKLYTDTHVEFIWSLWGEE